VVLGRVALCAHLFCEGSAHDVRDADIPV
jgi:hypothetical protein